MNPALARLRGLIVLHALWAFVAPRLIVVFLPDTSDLWKLLLIWGPPSVIYFCLINEFRRRPQILLSTLDIIVVVLVGAALRYTSGALAPVLENDFHRYFLDAELLVRGYNPYLLSPASALKLGSPIASLAKAVDWPQLPTLYPPVAEGFFVLTRSLGLSDRNLGLQLSFGVLEIGIVAMGCCMLRSKRSRGFWIFAIALNPLLVKEIYNSLHYDLLPVLFVLAALLVDRDKLWHRFSAGLLLALAVASKIYPLLLVPLFVMRWKHFRLSYLGGIFLGLGAVYGIAWFFLGSFPWGSTSVFATEWLWNAPLQMILRLVVSPFIAKIISAGLVTWGLFALYRRPWELVDSAFARVAAQMLFIFLICSSVFQPWYFLWLLPLAALSCSLDLLALSPLLFLSYAGFFDGTQWSRSNVIALGIEVICGALILKWFSLRGEACAVRRRLH
ncbi:MAG: hypothetical protein ABIO95_07600 [Bdellovibrionota bacterium]